MTRIVYLAHPVAGDVPGNLARAKRWYLWILRSFPDVSVIADWIITCEVMNDADTYDRERGMRANAALVPLVDEVWLCGGRVSAGMQAEVDIAHRDGIPVRSFIDLGAEPPSEPSIGTIIAAA